MIISELPKGQLREWLAHPGLAVRTGPFDFHIQTEISELADGLRLLYEDFPILPHPDFADFHIRFNKVRSWRWGFRPYVSVEVDGDRPSAPVPLDQFYAVFEGCLNWCIYTYAHQYLIIHAASIERGGHAVLLPAPPGSGKSTLCAALIHRGWRLLTDELSLIDTESRSIVPLGRPVSLKNESIEIIKNFAPDAIFGPISRNTVKGTIAHVKPPPNTVGRLNDHSRVAWMVFPSFRSGAAISVREMSKGEAFMRIAESAVNYMALGQIGFDILSALVDEIVCCRFEYGDLNEAVQWFDELSNDNFPTVIKPGASID